MKGKQASLSPALFFCIEQVGGSNPKPQQRFAKTSASAGFNDCLSSNRTQI
jgi:hypothetical protein